MSILPHSWKHSDVQRPSALHCSELISSSCLSAVLLPRKTVMKESGFRELREAKKSDKLWRFSTTSVSGRASRLPSSCMPHMMALTP